MEHLLPIRLSLTTIPPGRQEPVFAPLRANRMGVFPKLRLLHIMLIVFSPLGCIAFSCMFGLTLLFSLVLENGCQTTFEG